MPNDYESGTRKTIDISVKAEKITADILKTALQDFLNGNSEKKGRISYKQLEKNTSSKLESIEVTESNIGDFLSTARKYDVDFALRKDKTTSPPTYHIFFSADKTENFKRAFSEYAVKSQNKLNSRGEMSIEQLKQESHQIANQPRRKEKEREKSRENMR